MTNYMQIVDNAPVGYPVTRPQAILYTDPGSGENTTISAVNLTDAQLLSLAGWAAVDAAFAMPAQHKYSGGGTFDQVTGLATPATEELPLATVKSAAKADIAAWTEALRVSTVDGAGPYEVAGWAVKAERAFRFSQGTESAEDTALMQAEADSRGLGETAADLAAIQLAKAQALSSAISLIDGKEDAADTAIDAATDIAEPDTIAADFKATLTAALAVLIGGA